MNYTAIAAEHYQKGEYKQAIEFFERAALSGDSLGYYNVGVCHQALKEYDKAIAFFEKAIPSGNHLAFYNIGVCHQDLKQYEQALLAYQKALEINAECPLTLCNLSFVLSAMGQAKEGIAYADKAYALAPAHPAIGATSLALWCKVSPINEWVQIANKIMDNKNALESHKYLASIYSACALWALEQKRFPINYPAPITGYSWVENMGIYQQLLQNLADQKDESIYFEGPPVSMAGDSHVLSYAGLEHNNKKISSQLIIGAKAFHIASEKPNRYQAAFKGHIERLKPGSELLCCFGEIDCRIDEGIIPYQQKAGRNLKDVVEEQVTNYVQAVSRFAPNLDVTFVNIPAPVPGMGDRRDVVRLFNEQLSKLAKVVDVYAASVGDDGYAQAGKHVDQAHLKPEVFCQAEQVAL